MKPLLLGLFAAVVTAGAAFINWGVIVEQFSQKSLPSTPAPNKSIEELVREASPALAFTKLPTTDQLGAKEGLLGKKLFFDKRFSANGHIACSSCHQPELAFTDGKRLASGLEVTDRNTPTLLNSFANYWFFWDGRKDSLAAQALEPLENHLEHGISRGRVAQLLWRHYRKDYEETFGPFPTALQPLLASEKIFEAMPLPSPARMPLETAAYGVATISTFSIQQRLIAMAQSRRESPQRTLSQTAGASLPPPQEWVEQFNLLNKKQRQALNTIFANFGLAVAAFEGGIIAYSSPFDNFATRLATAPNPEDALGEGFGEVEWRGYQLFLTKGCTSCHHGPNFTDQQFHNIGLEQKGEQWELGRALGIARTLKDEFNCRRGLLPVTMSESCLELAYANDKNLEYVGAFKTPTLRNVAQTAPYMHDGRFKSLDDVLIHYNKLDAEPAIGHRDEVLRPMQLKPKDLEAIKAFLISLTSPVEILWDENPKIAKP